ncbi:hypothetical protein L6164_031348 [Bauhinia variegata]|uniref:Uncharacterized protein n=1 Tax=Bauhinia variegata TaxID=167791 RepID=A0ACB9LF65_BAUVA|nr:hypothetical protein L6164_031348 [Bauhinia variegata]
MVFYRWREILLEWKYDKNYEQNFQMVQVEVLPPMKVCQFCKKKFNSGQALGGHIRTHYKELRRKNYLNHFKMEEDSSSRSSKFHDGFRVLPKSWGFRQKRSSRLVVIRDKTEAQVNTKRQELKAAEIAAEEEETNHDGESAMLESLKELAGSSEHQITRKGKGVQVSEAIGTDAITEAEAAVVEGSDGSGSVNQVADEASANCKKLEFDLNELLPLPIEDNDA